jgi:RNA-directed DNA polymerase
MAKRGREVDGRWEWTEPSVWTERMLDALERGVKGGKWYSLIDKVYAQETLAAAWKRVKRNRGSAGVDRETIDDFGRRAETRLARLAQQIEGDTYEAKPIRRTWIPKPGSSELRPLGIPTVTDRIAETAL